MKTASVPLFSENCWIGGRRRTQLEQMQRRMSVVIPQLERQIAREEKHRVTRLIRAHDVDERLEYRGFVIDEDPADEDKRIVQASNGTVFWGFESVAQAAMWLDRWMFEITGWVAEGAMPRHLRAVME